MLSIKRVQLEKKKRGMVQVSGLAKNADLKFPLLSRFSLPFRLTTSFRNA